MTLQRSALRACTAMLCTLLLTGCASTIKGTQYRDVAPAFDLIDFFTGNVDAWGIVQDRSGNVIQRFTVDLSGRLEDNTLILDETFSYGIGDGLKQRTWRLTTNADGTYRGVAGDVPDGAIGTRFGNAVNLKYSFDLPVGDTTYKVKFDDWFWAFDRDTIINRSYIRKFGFTVADVTIFMRRDTGAATR